MSGFDFQALVNQPLQDDPDARLFVLIERHDDLRRDLHGGRISLHGLSYSQGCQAVIRFREEIALFKPKTREGAVAKVRMAARAMHRCPASDLLWSSMQDALRFMGERVTDRRRKMRS